MNHIVAQEFEKAVCGPVGAALHQLEISNCYGEINWQALERFKICE